jgi:hemerythrin
MIWDDSLSIDIEGIDNQHHRLVLLINLLHDAMKEGRAKDVMRGVLQELTEYTVYHFSVEENFMLQHRYPDYVSHKQEHDEFVKKVQAVTNEFNAGNHWNSVSVMSFLKDWLRNHICIIDKQYAPFFKEKGFQ